MKSARENASNIPNTGDALKAINMKMTASRVLFRATLIIWSAFLAIAGNCQQPRVTISNTGQLLVDNSPQILLGGELSNSAAGTASGADEILPKLAHAHLNTVL